jgi:hypothetical protein
MYGHAKKGFDTKKEAQLHEVEMRAKLINPSFITMVAGQGKQTVRDYLLEWIENHGTINLRPSTFAGYKSNINTDDELIAIAVSILLFSLIFAPYTKFIIMSIAYPETILHYLIMPNEEGNLQDRWYIINTIGDNILLGDSHIEENCTTVKFIKKETLIEKVIYIDILNNENGEAGY